jgi:uncharacterized caspase-like protein
MTRWRPLVALLWLLPLAGACLPAQGQAVSEVPGPVGGAPARLPAFVMPEANTLALPVPRPVRAATAALGLSRQRLALVAGIGTVGASRVVDSASRDTQAVAAALRDAGFVVMIREDVNAADLRASLAEYRGRLQPGGVGLVYLTGLGVQLEGRNFLLPRDAHLDPDAAPPALAGALRRTGVPLDEAVQALLGPPGSVRLLVADAAYRHPALARLPRLGLAEQKLPPGTMALFGHALGSLQEQPAVAALPSPAPAAARDIAASRFARALVDALATPRLSGAQVLRQTRRAIIEATKGQDEPWLAGDTNEDEELAETTFLDSLIPRTPGEVAREGISQAANLNRQHSAARAGEQTVAEVLQRAASTPATEPGSSPAPDEASRAPPQPTSAAGSILEPAARAAASVAGAAGSAVIVAAGVQAVAAAAAPALAIDAAAATTSSAGRMVATAAAPGAPSGLAPVAVGAATPPAQASIGAAQQLARAVATQAAGGSAPEQQQASPPTQAATRPVAGGGERPVYVPRTNAFGYAQGDTFTYQVIDTWKGEVRGRFTTAIEEVLDDGQLLANGRQVRMDAQGRFKTMTGADGNVSEFTPAQELWWSKPSRGQSRSVRFTETFHRAGGESGRIEWKGSASVGRSRTVTLPAGEFDVLPIETSGWYTSRLTYGQLSSGQFSRTVWYSTKLGHPVAIDLEDADRLGKLLKRERIELLHVQAARAAPP